MAEKRARRRKRSRWGDEDWQAWRERIWQHFHPEGTGRPGDVIAGLACLEQAMSRSLDEQRCVECGAPGTVRQQSVLVASVPSYWMCQACAGYWTARAAAESRPARPHGPGADVSHDPATCLACGREMPTRRCAHCGSRSRWVDPDPEPWRRPANPDPTLFSAPKKGRPTNAARRDRDAGKAVIL